MTAEAGRTSVHARTLDGTTTCSVDADALHYAASTMKVAVLLALARALDEGALSLADVLPVSGSYTGLDGDPFSVDVEDRDHALLRRGRASVRLLARSMITTSSNDATNVLVERLGLAAVHDAMGAAGAHHGRVGRLINDLRARDAGVSNDVSAEDLTAMLAAVATGRAAAGATCRWMLGLLLQQEHRDTIPAALPAHWLVASKPGATRHVLHDAAVVWPPARQPVVVAVCTSGLGAEEGLAAIHRAVAAVVQP